MEGKVNYNLYLDDSRAHPVVSFKLMEIRIGQEASRYINEEWVIVKDYPSFVKYIQENGLPHTVSFDHDLADEHYAPEEAYKDYNVWAAGKEFKEKTGLHCAQWLIEFCELSGRAFPTYYVHSMNPAGAKNIKDLIEDYEKKEEWLKEHPPFASPYEFARDRQIDEIVKNKKEEDDRRVEGHNQRRIYVPDFESGKS